MPNIIIGALLINVHSIVPESATRTALHIAESNPSKDRNDDKGKENNTGVIVGAVIGGIAGLSLICGALFLGIRLGKKRSRKRNGRDDSEATRDDGSKFITQTARADKHSSQLEATDPGTMPVTMQNMNDGLVSNSYGRDVNAQRLLPELPTENTRHPRNGSTQELP